MRIRSICIVLALLTGLLVSCTAATVQESGCPAIVWYGAPNGSPGKDEGQCRSEEQACATLDYALKQGQRICSQQVHVFYVDQNRRFEQLQWDPPSTAQQFTDWLWSGVYWLLPIVSLIVGWLVAYWLFRRRRGGVQ